MSVIHAGIGLDGSYLDMPQLAHEPLPIRRIMPAPCTQACPAGVQVKAYVSLIAEERFAEALEVVRRRCPLPGICGRICDHPCEAACRRGGVDDPVAIRALKRFVADREREFPLPAPPPGAARVQKVAVIGSGPAGLAAAYDLRLEGYPVTVLEAESEPGGMLRYGIAAYRLPRDVLDAEIDVLQRAGVEIRTGMRVGREVELEALLREGYASVLLACGAQRGRQLGLPGEADHAEIEDALAFLRRVNAGSRERVGEKVLVIGGGSTAVEAARASRRLGAESVQILYRRSEDELLAGHEEIEAAQAEGVRFHFLRAPVGIHEKRGRFAGLVVAQVGLGEADASGRRRPILIPGSEEKLEADRVFAAVGQEVDFDFLPARSRRRMLKDQGVVVDDETAMTRLRGVFAAGDMVSGPATVISAIASGHRASESIRHFLEEGAPGIREQRPEKKAPREYQLADAPPVERPRVPLPTRLPRPGREFAEVEGPYSAEQAVEEARRCLRCGPCGECRICAPSCQRRHMVADPVDEGESVLLRAPANLALSLRNDAPIAARILSHRREHAANVKVRPLRNRVSPEECRGCGSCVDACPFEAITLEDGPQGHPLASVERARCRGCNVCRGVCPTGAARPAAALEGEDSPLRELLAPSTDGQIDVVLACQRRAGALPAHLEEPGRRTEVVRLRCVGEVTAGTLVGLLERGVHRILVAGCDEDRCRFGSGARLAAEQLGQTRQLLRVLGWPADRLRADWSPDRAHDRLEEALERMHRGEGSS